MKRYSILLLEGMLGILLAMSMFNWLINPYDIFSSPSIKNINSYKVSVERYARLSKVYQIEKIKPDTILLASSKGIEVPVNYFSETIFTGFNSALLGSSIYELLRMMQHAQSVAPLKRVVLALDEEFISGTNDLFVEDRLLVNYHGEINKNRFFMKLRDFSQSLFGLAAFRSSLRTLKMQKEDPLLIGDELHQLNKIRQRGGHHQMFKSREAYVLSGSAVENSQDCTKANIESDSYDVAAVKYFTDIVDLAYQNNIELHIYFAPVHARYYETMCLSGKWVNIENMKKMVVDIVANKSETYHHAAYPIWDFSGYSEITTEELPSLEDKDHLMAGYWDDSHYTLKTAKLLFDKLFMRNDIAEDFGVLISRNNIDRHLENIRSDRVTYIKEHAEDIAELEMIMKNNVK